MTYCSFVCTENMSCLMCSSVCAGLSVNPLSIECYHLAFIDLYNGIMSNTGVPGIPQVHRGKHYEYQVCAW